MGFDTRFDRKVLIRIIDNVEDEQVKERFIRFIKNSGQLVHPSILSVNDYGFEGNRLFSIHEYVDIDSARLTPERINLLDDAERIEAVQDILDAVIFAHTSGICHRNLFPDSVHLIDVGRVKVDMFDLRRYLVNDKLVSELGFETDTQIFMSPEELRGKSKDKLTDVFQFGCLLYYIMTGHPPFGGKDTDKIVKALKKAEFINPSYFSQAAASFKKVVEKCVAADPKHRYQSLEDAAGDILAVTRRAEKPQDTGSAPFKFEIKDGKAYMTVMPGTASMIKLDEIEKRFLNENIYNYDMDKIAECVRQQDGRQHLIGDAFSKADPAALDEVEIIVNPDALSAYVSIPAGLEPSKDELKFFLKKNGIRYGHIDENIDKVLSQYDHSRIPVAKGVAPVRGEDGYIMYFFEKDNPNKPKISDGDIADFKEIHTIQEIRKGDVLCMKVPPTDGTDGTTVFSSPIKAEAGKDIKLPVGKNTVISPDGMKLLAAIDGQISMPRNKVNILELMVINSDVDYSVGNVRYKGDVIVRGDVLPDFSVHAGGNIVIYGVVEGANITSDRGSIKVKGGVFGKDKGIIKALRDIKADFLQDVSAEAGCDITVQNYIRNSKLLAGKNVKCTSGIGSITGSTVEAGMSIEANNAGTRPYVKTRLIINVKSKQQIKRLMDDLQDKMNRTLEAVKIIKKQAKRIILRHGTLEEAQEDREYNLTIDKLKHLEEYMKGLGEKLDIVISDYDERDEDFSEFVLLRRYMYGDVTVKIGNCIFVSKEEYEGRCYLVTDNNRLYFNGTMKTV